MWPQSDGLWQTNSGSHPTQIPLTAVPFKHPYTCENCQLTLRTTNSSNTRLNSDIGAQAAGRLSSVCRARRPVTTIAPVLTQKSKEKQGTNTAQQAEEHKPLHKMRQAKQVSPPAPHAANYVQYILLLFASVSPAGLAVARPLLPLKEGSQQGEPKDRVQGLAATITPGATISDKLQLPKSLPLTGP